jgi:hypothetical protein
MLKRATTLIALVGAAAFSTGSSGAATTSDLCVGSKPGCFATIQAAVDAAQDGDTIKVGPGAFAGGITIRKSVRLVGVAAGATTIQGGGPVITIGMDDVAPTVSIARLTITGGFNDSPGVAAGGGVLIEPAPDNSTGATVTIADSAIVGNRVAPRATFSEPAPCDPVPFDQCAFAVGGGIDNSGTLTVTGTRVGNNQVGPGVASGASGAGITNHPQGTLTLSRSVVTGNRAVATAPNGRFADGGGIDSPGVLKVEESVVSGNVAEVSSAVASAFPFDIQQEANAGGIRIAGSGTITRSIVSGNSVRSSNTIGDAFAAAGGIDSDGELILSQSTVAHNEVSASVPHASGSTAVAVGGGLEGGGFDVRDGVLSGNSVRADSATGAAIVAGGGLANDGQTALVRSLVIANSGTANGAGGLAQGGGISNVNLGSPPELALTDSVVSANKLSASLGITLLGGGIWTDTLITLIRTLVAGNHPDQCFGC